MPKIYLSVLFNAQSIERRRTGYSTQPTTVGRGKAVGVGVAGWFERGPSDGNGVSNTKPEGGSFGFVGEVAILVGVGVAGRGARVR